MSIEKIDRYQPDESLEVLVDPSHTPSSLRCDHCHLSVRLTYHEVDGRILCSPCKWEMEKAHRDGLNSRRMVFATSLGTLAAVGGAGIFFTILSLFEFKFAAIPLIIGILVGIAVRTGARRRGGPVYQALAMILTYIAVAATQFPAIHDSLPGYDDVSNFTSRALDPMAYANSPLQTPVSPMPAEVFPSDIHTGTANTTQLLHAFVSPVTGMADNISGFAFLCTGLLAAWKLNKRARMTINRKKIHRVLGLESDLVISGRCRES